jgi:hypothetical protein
MTTAPGVPLDGGSYRREFEARLDVPEVDRILVRGRLRDGRKTMAAHARRRLTELAPTHGRGIDFFA